MDLCYKMISRELPGIQVRPPIIGNKLESEDYVTLPSYKYNYRYKCKMHRKHVIILYKLLNILCE